jgi:hypothetical protein
MHNRLSAVLVEEFGAGSVEGSVLVPNGGGAWQIAPGCQVRGVGNQQ